MVGKRLSYYRPALPEFVSLYVVTSKMLCIRGYLFRGQYQYSHSLGSILTPPSALWGGTLEEVNKDP